MSFDNLKQILNFPNYFISAGGQVWSDKSGRFLIPIKRNKRGYLGVNLCKNGLMKMGDIHRLVLETFVGPCPAGMECRHLDDNPTNNNLDNLKWGTRKENIADSIKHGTHKIPDNRGERQGLSKLTEKDVRMIIYMYKTGEFTQGGIAKLYNITPSNIHYIITKKTWRHLWTI